MPVLILLALLFSQGSALASGDDLQQVERNGDGSWLRLTQRRDETMDSRSMQLELGTGPTAFHRTVLQRRQSISGHPRGGSRLEDMDGDGLLEYVEREFCGAGTNCSYRIFKVSPSQGTAYSYFQGSFFRFRAIGDFIVTSGRSSCCSWEHQVFRQPDEGAGISDLDLLYLIEVKGPVDGAATAECLITRPVGDAWVPAATSSQQLLELCEVYGDDVVVTPPPADRDR